MAEEMSSINIYSRVQTDTGWITDTKKADLKCGTNSCFLKTNTTEKGFGTEAIRGCSSEPVFA